MARSRVAKDLSVYIAASISHSKLILSTGSAQSLQLRGVVLSWN